ASPRSLSARYTLALLDDGGQGDDGEALRLGSRQPALQHGDGAWMRMTNCHGVTLLAGNALRLGQLLGDGRLTHIVIEKDIPGDMRDAHFGGHTVTDTSGNRL